MVVISVAEEWSGHWVSFNISVLGYVELVVQKKKRGMKLALEDKGAVCPLGVSYILLLKFKARRRKQK